MQQQQETVMQQEQMKAEIQMQLEQAKAQIQMQMEAQKLQGKAQADILLQQQKIESTEKIAAANIIAEQQRAEITKGVDSHRAEMSSKTVQKIDMPDANNLANAVKLLADTSSKDKSVEALIAELKRPLTIQRDESGVAVSIH